MCEGQTFSNKAEREMISPRGYHLHHCPNEPIVGRGPNGVPQRDIFKELTKSELPFGYLALPEAGSMMAPPGSSVFLFLGPEAKPA